MPYICAVNQKEKDLIRIDYEEEEMKIHLQGAG